MRLSPALPRTPGINWMNAVVLLRPPPMVNGRSSRVLRLHDVAQVGALSFQQRRGGGDFHLLVDGTDRQCHVHVGNGVHVDLHVGGFRFPEARLFDSDGVNSRTAGKGRVYTPSTAGSHCLDQAGVDVPDGHCGLRYGCPRCVCHHSPDRAAILSETGTGEYQNHNEESLLNGHRSPLFSLASLAPPPPAESVALTWLGH